jgi:hypothetical protein
MLWSDARRKGVRRSVVKFVAVANEIGIESREY